MTSLSVKKCFYFFLFVVALAVFFPTLLPRATVAVILSEDQIVEESLPEPEGVLYRKNEIVVKWKPSLEKKEGDEKLTQTLHMRAAHGIRTASLYIRRDYTRRNFSVISSEKFSTAKLLERFNNLPTVEYAHENIIFRAQAETTPWGVGNSTGVKAIQAHDESFAGTGVTVAVIDTGVDLDHTDLDANVVTGTDIYNNDSDPNDDNGHGTHVAGIIAAEKNNDAGIVGVAPSAKIMPIKVLGNDGAGDYTDIVGGIDYAVDHGANIINLSLGAMNTGAVLKDMQDSIDAAETAGVIVVAAAGNNASAVPFVPAMFENVISVGAIQETVTAANPDTNYNTRLSYFSNFGKINLVAPGSGIESTWIDNQTATSDGTSMAAPFVAGVAALVKGKNTQLTPAKIRHILETTAADLGATGKDEFFGSGLVDADAALDKTGNSTTKTMIVDGNWNDNSSTIIENNYYIEPTLHSSTLSADGSSSTTVRVRAAYEDGTPIANETVTLSATAGTITTASASTDSTGMVMFILTAPATAGSGTATATLMSTGITKSIPLIFADTLIVSDAGQPIDAGIEGWFFTRAMEAAGAYWKMSTQAYPSSEDSLTSYDNVVWHTNRGSLDATEQENIKTFLDAGGHIFISGGDILYTNYYYTNISATQPTLAVDTILSPYLKVQYKKYVASTLTFVGDRSFEGTGSSLNDFGSIQNNFGFSDVVTVLSGGINAGYFCSNTENATVTVTGTYRSIFLGIALDGYSENDDGTTTTAITQTARQEIINNALDFLNATTQRGGTFTTPTACDSSQETNDGSGNDETNADTTSDLPIPGLPNQPVTVGEEVLSNIALSERTDTSIALTWDTSITLASSLVYTQNTITGKIESSAIGEDTSASIDNLTPHTIYDFIVYGVRNDGTQTAAATLTARTLPGAPQAPTSTTIKRTSLAATLVDPAETGLQFRVEFRNSKKTKTLQSVTLGVGIHEITFSDLDADTTYNIRAMIGYTDEDNNEILSAWSPDAEITTSTDRVAKPSIAKKDIFSKKIRLRWAKPSERIKKYHIEIWQRQGNYYVQSQRITSTKNLKKTTQRRWIRNLIPNTSYRLRVRAIFKDETQGRFSKYINVETL